MSKLTYIVTECLCTYHTYSSGGSYGGRAPIAHPIPTACTPPGGMVGLGAALGGASAAPGGPAALGAAGMVLAVTGRDQIHSSGDVRVINPRYLIVTVTGLVVICRENQSTHVEYTWLLHLMSKLAYIVTECLCIYPIHSSGDGGGSSAAPAHHTTEGGVVSSGGMVSRCGVVGTSTGRRACRTGGGRSSDGQGW